MSGTLSSFPSDSTTLDPTSPVSEGVSKPRRPVQVYRNLHKPGVVWSVRAAGRVVDRSSDVVLKDAVFKVSDAGRARALLESTRNVHAYVKGDRVSSFPSDPWLWRDATYDLWGAGRFVDLLADSFVPLSAAPWVRCTDEGMLFASPDPAGDAVDVVVLEGGWHNPVLVGSTVRRVLRPDRRSRQLAAALLRRSGVLWVPPPLGVDSQGREVWGFVPGEVVSSRRLDVSQLVTVASWLSVLHKFTAGSDGLVLTHSDVHGGNVVFDADPFGHIVPVALIDWEWAHRDVPEHDLAVFVYGESTWSEDVNRFFEVLSAVRTGYGVLPASAPVLADRLLAHARKVLSIAEAKEFSNLDVRRNWTVWLSQHLPEVTAAFEDAWYSAR